MKTQAVTFDVTPTPDPNGVRMEPRLVVNANDGIGMKELITIVQEHVPVSTNENIRTVRTIIRTDRIESPFHQTTIMALVGVRCCGRLTEKDVGIQGLYSVEIAPQESDCLVKVLKLSPTTIYEGRTPLLPRKDYEDLRRTYQTLQRHREIVDELLDR